MSNELKQTQMLDTQPVTSETNEEKADEMSGVWGRLLPIGAAFSAVGMFSICWISFWFCLNVIISLKRGQQT